MKALIIYDTAYGNTEAIAKAIGSSIAGDVREVRVTAVDPSGLNNIDLLIIGSPTLGGRPTPAILAFIDGIPDTVLKNRKVASFDTRLSTKWVGIFGYAADKIAESLQTKGANLVTPPAAFYVKGRQGPLKEGELERATDWAKAIVK